jgi:release factor glutamine methyltransferase
VSGLSAVREVERELAAAGVPDPRTDAELLVSHVLAVPRSAVPLAELREEDAARLRALVERRARREPLQHVLGEWGFRRLTLRVDARALVPRPETEIVVERCLALLRHVAEPHVVDVGTGSGAIALALADERPDLEVLATETSAGALAVARANAARLSLTVEFLEGDLLEPVSGRVDAVVSNPPYVAAGERLAPELGYEPVAALSGGKDGLDVYRRLVPAAARARFVALEVGAGQGPDVTALVREAGFQAVEVVPDLAGIERVVVGRR